jgi:hypothetical protein
MLTHAHLKLTQHAQAQSGVANPPNQGVVGAHFYNLGENIIASLVEQGG